MTREEAIKKVRWGLLGLVIDKEVRDALETLIPELRESEDERIRKETVSALKFANDGGVYDKHIAYLEKQKEHQFCSDAPKEKSVGGNFSSSHKDKNLDEIAQDYVDGVKEYNPEPTWDLMQTAVCYGYHYCDQKKQKPEERFKEAREKYQVEWSEEDERIIDTITYVLGQYIDYKAVSGTGSGYATPRYSKEIAWLKSLRPSWKPSEEQMEALEYVIRDYREDSCNTTANYLQEVIDHLKNM